MAAGVAGSGAIAVPAAMRKSPPVPALCATRERPAAAFSPAVGPFEQGTHDASQPDVGEMVHGGGHFAGIVGGVRSAAGHVFDLGHSLPRA